jgi:hypothetical protein
MTEAFQADVESGIFELLTADIAKPTEELPHDCDGLTNYEDIDSLIDSIVEAASFDAWL